MSAFAFRKRLLAGQDDSSSSETSLSPATAITTESSSGQAGHSPKKSTPRQKRARKDGLPRNAPQQASVQLVLPAEEPVSVMATAQFFGLPDPEAVSTPPLEVTPAVAPTRAPALFFSTYTPSKANYRRHKDGTTVITLCDSERLVLLGSYGMRLRSGKITINGATLTPQSGVTWVDAPQCYALPVMRAVDDSVVELHSHLANKDLRGLASVSPLFRGLWLDDQGSTFKIVPTSHDGPKRTILQDLVFLPEWNREAVRLSKASSFGPITVMVTGPKSSGKSTFGKMLANRIITESNLESSSARSTTGLAILDFDPGQPEYGVPGQVSLVHILEPVLSPSFTRPIPLQSIRTIRAHSLASISPASDPELYLEAAKDLYTYYRNTVGSSSLIINTPGWIQGTGLDLLVSLVTDLRPTEVVYMSQTGPSDTVEGLYAACRHTTFTMLPSNTISIAAKSAVQLRSMQLMSYFHVEPVERSRTTLTSGAKNQKNCAFQTAPPYSWITTPLTHFPPWQVRYGPLTQGSAGHDRVGIAGILCYDYLAPPAFLADAINGNILALVEVEDVRAFRGITHPQQESSRNPQDDGGLTNDMDIDTPPTLPSLIHSLTTRTPEGLPLLDTKGATLDPQYSRFLGLALVRGIDVDSRVLQLITPVPASELDRVLGTEEGDGDMEAEGEHGGGCGRVVLVSGKFDTPSWAYTEDFYYQASLASQGHGGGGSSGQASVSVGNTVEMDYEDDDEGGDDGEGDFNISFGAVEAEQSALASVPPRPTATDTPWIEELRGSQRRGIGSKVWRVRRDLGRSNNAGE
ncbi:polynucleotide 5'-hydroxyl-kinase GRC3/NOL9 [Microdochium nivale]|nr:polynucleotide 5'-hydroxyl-kinase GRC3/NOL9 [Microdochium nivale]